MRRPRWFLFILGSLLLAGSGAGIDVEDGVELAAPVLDRLCPPQLRPLATFGIRNHDYIKDVFRGEVPAGYLADQLADLDVPLRAVALAVLGMIQVAGAASLGEGRLSAFRVAIFERCFDTTALDDQSAETRLARLLTAHEESIVIGTPVMLPSEGRGLIRQFLERCPLHGWHRAWEHAAEHGDDTKLRVLHALASIWAATRTDHVVLAPEADLRAAADEKDPRSFPVREQRLLNGTVAAVVG